MSPRLKFYSGEMPKRKRSREEAQLQEAVCQCLLLQRCDGVLYFAVPNGLVSDAVAVANMKLQGLLPGAADLVLFVPQDDGRARPYCLELKSQSGRQETAQRAFQLACERIGVVYAIADNSDDAFSLLKEWGAIRPEFTWFPRRAAQHKREQEAVGA